MIYTNKHNLPEFLVRALKRADQDYWEERNAQKVKSDYSVTQILSCPRQVWLLKRHWRNIIKDVSENIRSFTGSAVHAFVEKGEGENDIVEERLIYSIVLGNKIITLSGKPDNYGGDIFTIYDFKTTKVYTVKYKTQFKHWQIQLSLYAFLFRQYGFRVENIENTVLMLDHNANMHSEISPIPFISIKHELLEEIEGLPVEQFIKERVGYLESFRDADDNDLPLCSDEDRWATAPSWEIWFDQSQAKEKKPSFTFKESEQELAEAKQAELNEKGKGKKTYTLVFNEGNPWKKCEQWCNAHAFCNQFQNRILETKEKLIEAV